MTARHAVVLLLATAALASPPPLDAQADPAVAGLEWLAGAWVLERTGERLEESWSAPVGSSMVGHFRWIRSGELWITELLSITAEAGGVVFRLRHFGPGMEPWEAADDPFSASRAKTRADRRGRTSDTGGGGEALYEYSGRAAAPTRSASWRKACDQRWTSQASTRSRRWNMRPVRSPASMSMASSRARSMSSGA